MPRSIQEILDHADELAKRFEDYEPSEGDERPVEEYLLERAALARARSEQQVLDAVVVARVCRSDLAEDRRHPGHVSAGCATALRLRHRIGLSVETVPTHR